jgi:DNA end-binding protein Ku
MSYRAIVSASISFGLVAIPIKVYSASDDNKLTMNYINPETKSRIGQKWFDKTTLADVELKDMALGYEHEKDQYLIFTKDELKALESPKTAAFDIKEFVSISSVDFCQIEKTYYLSPDKGGDKAYQMLSIAMEQEQKVALGMWTSKGKDHLVMIRSHKGGLVLHQLFYADELRDFTEVNKCAKVAVSDKEAGMAKQLIKQLTSDTIDLSPYKDGYRERVLEAVEQKKNGQEVTIHAEAPVQKVNDLFAALQASLNAANK